MKSRYRPYVVAIALLAAINVGRWVFVDGKPAPEARERMLVAQDFRLGVDVPNGAVHGRDLFVPGGAASVRGLGAKSAHAGRKAWKPVAPASAPDAAQVMAQAGLGRLRLLGVVFHAGKRQAYLAQDNENCIAAAGDTVFGQYAVDDITVDAVQIRDTKTNLTRRIPVSGK